MLMKMLMLSQASTVTKLRWRLAGLALLVTLGAHAGDFSVQDLQGKPRHLKDYRGHWVLVNFWGTWCSPCLSEIPELNRLQEAHPNLVVIGVAMQSGSSAKVADFVADHHMHYPIVMGTRVIAEQIRSAAQQVEELEVLPTSYLFGLQGELVYAHTGEIKRGTLDRYLQTNKSY